MENIMSHEDLYNYIDGVTYRKSTLMRCLKVMLKREEYAIDEVSYITTFNSENDEGRCKKDEICIRMHFPGYAEECMYLKYSQFFRFIKEGFLSNINYFSEENKKEIEATIQILESTFND